MAEVNRLCVPVLVQEEDLKENSTQRRQDSLLELVQTPITCLVGSMKSMSEAISHLPLLQTLRRPLQVSGENEKSESTADDDQTEKPSSLTWLMSPSSTVATEKRTEDKLKMVELYQCPPFSDLPVSLPHNTAYTSIASRVIQAQRHLLPTRHLKASFQKILCSLTVERFIIDSFWWLFLQKFQPDRKTQDRLFCRIAENYIRILTQNLSTHSGTTFLQNFPSTLSQTLYCCFCCCFPQSCSFRDPAFLTELCSTAYQWTGGFSPGPEVYKWWEFEALEPGEAVGVWVSDGRPKESVNNAGLEDMSDPDLKALTDHTTHTAVRESGAVYEGEELKCCVFNVWGNSPLTQQYMTNHSLKPSVGYDLLVTRTQIQNLLPADSLTYRDVLKQAQQRSSSHQRALSSLWAQQAKELASLKQKHADEHVELLRKHKKILSQKSSVRQLCQLLVPPVQGEEDKKTRSEQLQAFEMTLASMK